MITCQYTTEMNYPKHISVKYLGNISYMNLDSGRLRLNWRFNVNKTRKLHVFTNKSMFLWTSLKHQFRASRSVCCITEALLLYLGVGEWLMASLSDTLPLCTHQFQRWGYPWKNRPALPTPIKRAKPESWGFSHTRRFRNRKLNFTVSKIDR